ncbi:ATP-dependent DNA helicase [Ochrobactrum phage vB_OspM_OC]|nr:ATP-dependent DNA helicase [Ochrobactrum phage vB_OspM_OC]
MENKTDIIVKEIDDVFCEVITDNEAILREISDEFSFKVDGYEVMKRANPNLKYWDGMIRLFNVKKRTLYKGLVITLVKWAEGVKYTIDNQTNFVKKDIDLKEVKQFFSDLKLKEADRLPRDYQLKAFLNAIAYGRCSFLSPVNSGKSLIIYLLIRWFNVPSLIIVPTVNLVNQMLRDFADYSKFDDSWNAYDNCQIIMGGLEKEFQRQVIISTWQSLKDLPEEWYINIKQVIVDEVHGAKAKSIQKIMEKLKRCPHRFGLTGTFDDVEVNKLTIVGHFGNVYNTVSTKELQDRGISAQLDIEFKILDYENLSYTTVPKDYQREIEYIKSHPYRNEYIRDLTLSLDGNILVLFQHVDSHGVGLYNLIKMATNRKVFIIHGGIKVDEREKILAFFKSGKAKDAILIASYGTTSTGINVAAFNNMIFASPYKSKVKVWQSIGRLLRTSEDKTHGKLYDIVDCIRNGKSYKTKNYCMQHFLSRLKIYNSEGQKYTMTKVSKKDWWNE